MHLVSIVSIVWLWQHAPTLVSRVSIASIVRAHTRARGGARTRQGGGTCPIQPSRTPCASSFCKHTLPHTTRVHTQYTTVDVLTLAVLTRADACARPGRPLLVRTGRRRSKESLRRNRDRTGSRSAPECPERLQPRSGTVAVSATCGYSSREQSGSSAVIDLRRRLQLTPTTGCNPIQEAAALLTVRRARPARTDWPIGGRPRTASPRSSDARRLRRAPESKCSHSK